MSNFDATPLQRQLMNLINPTTGAAYLAATDPATGKPNDDGVFGTLTQAALIQYQNNNHLAPSGQPDDPTMILLGLRAQPPAVVKWALPTFSIPAVFSDYVINWITSKTVWASTVGAVAIIGILNGVLSHLGIQLDNSATVALSALLLALLNGVLLPLLHAVFNKPKVVAGKVALKAE